ncbi:MAG TPA: ATP phosphoribosyltransferase [Fimbriimonadaceae bacterium]|nr:ATP phosphoribosyltransferase [Fimbriimonadaceae bacterium]
MPLRLGLPKGSLQEATFSLFAKAGWRFRVDARSYQPVVDDPEIEPTLLRPQEIPRYVEEGVIDAGLTGLDWITDCGADVHEICELRYSKLTTNPIRVVLAVPKESPIKSAEGLAGKRIATEYVRLTERFMAEKGVKADVEFSWGACEVKVAQGVADAIVVNTETGSSLRAHNLAIIETLLTSTTRFVCGQSVWGDPEKREKLENMAILLQGAMNAAKLVGLKMNLPASAREEVLSILPALQNPTISPLADEKFLAIEVILAESDVRDLVPRLKRAGATGLVEYPLNKVIY